MNKLRQFLSLIILAAIVLAFAGCSAKTKDFDASGYIEAVLDCAYAGENELYIGYTSATAEEAAANNVTTVSNAAVRFFTKYQINASEEQKTALSVVFTDAYKQCKYSVQDKLKTETGYTVEVQYSPMTTFLDLENQIKSIRDEAGDTAYDVGAAYIDRVVELCANSVSSPTFGDTASKTIDILLNKKGELSLNIKLFDQLDEAILPL